MLDPTTPVTRVPNENIYNCVKILHSVYSSIGNESSWALVKLDREVKDQELAAISKKDISCDHPVYVIGHPMGLPLKYAAGARVRGLEEALFAADLDIYMGNSGSPVFDKETHQVIGMVVRGYQKDFRLVVNCLVSVIYPNPGLHSEEAHCTRVSEFRNIVDNLR